MLRAVCDRAVLLAVTTMLCAACGKTPTTDAPAAAVADTALSGAGGPSSWTAVGGDNRGQKYAPLADIDRRNVSRLKLAWRYDSGDFSKGTSEHGATALQVTPLMVESTLYFCTPYNRVIALDAESGRERWRYDPKVALKNVYTPVCRGVAWWRDAQAPPDAACRDRIFTNTLDARLLAVDAKTGLACAGFGGERGVNLLEGLGEVRSAEVYSTSPPLVIGDRVLTGAFVRDGQRVDAPGGGVRAYDARSGELLWLWDPVPPERKPVTAADVKNGATLTRGTPNVWGLMSADADAGLVYVPTGSPSPDHYGGSERAHMDYYGASIVALDAASGAVRWHFQTVHHDVWDYDIGAQPLLFEHRSAAGSVPALLASTKLGHVFVLNRLSGEPLFPVEERAVPQTTVPGETTAPTQPFPTLPPPLHGARLDRDELWGLTFWDRRKCEAQYDALDNGGMFTPPSLKGALEYPGLGGGINWGGASIDPVRGRMIVNLQTVPFVIKLVPRAEYEAAHPKIAAEQSQEPQTGRDPAGGAADANELVALNPQAGTPYVAVREPLLSPLMTPCIKPPWGRLVAIDLGSGAVQWQQPLGTLHGLAPLIGDRLHYGTPNSGGSLQTAGGLVFIAAAMDKYFRAIDGDSGAELWRYELPYAGNATPMSYRARTGGRQYIVIAAGGHGPLGTTPGDAIIAFTLDGAE